MGQAALAQNVLVKEMFDESTVAWRLKLGSRSTDVLFTAPTEPTLKVSRNDAYIFGTIQGAKSDSSLDSMAFIIQGDQTKIMRGYEIVASQGTKLLISPTLKNNFIDKRYAYIFDKGKTTEIGVARRVTMAKDGTVAGFYYTNDASTEPIRVAIAKINGPIYKQNFVWKSGKLTLTDKVQADPTSGY